MNYFLDFEFIEGFHKPLFGKRRHFIDMISVGIVAEDGREYYAISNEWEYKDADKWVQKNIIIPLYSKTVSGNGRNYFSAASFHKHFGKSNDTIAKEIVDFIYPNCLYNHEDCLPIHVGDPRGELPLFYGYFCDYDWVLFCSLFGRMIDLPKGFPIYCRDLKQMLDERAEQMTQLDLSFTILPTKEGWQSTAEIPKQIVSIDDYTFDMKIKLLKADTNYPKQTDEHNALADARWNFELYKFLQSV